MSLHHGLNAVKTLYTMPGYNSAAEILHFTLFFGLKTDKCDNLPTRIINECNFCVTVEHKRLLGSLL